MEHSILGERLFKEGEFRDTSFELKQFDKKRMNSITMMFIRHTIKVDKMILSHFHENVDLLICPDKMEQTVPYEYDETLV